MSKIIIITGADAKYFEMAQGALQSIWNQAPASSVKLGFLDLGCTPEQLEWLLDHKIVPQSVDWPFVIPNQNQIPEYVKGFLARPQLPEYFPGYDIYVWMDADAWVQDWRAIELFIQGAQQRGLAIVPEIERSSKILYGGIPKNFQWTYYSYESNYGEAVAKRLHTYPTLNAGIFALREDAPHWQFWGEEIKKCVIYSATRNYYHIAEQVSLNYAVYTHQRLFTQTELLPSWCNWTTHYGPPAWDKKRKLFVEPYLPHTPVGIIHLTGHKHQEIQTVITTDMDSIELTLWYDPKAHG